MMKTSIEVNTSWDKIGNAQSIFQEISKHVESLPIKELSFSYKDSSDLENPYVWFELKFEDGTLLMSTYNDFNNLFEWALFKSISSTKIIVKGKGCLSELFEQIKKRFVIVNER